MNNRDAQLTLLQGQLVAARATQASLQQRVNELERLLGIQQQQQIACAFQIGKRVCLLSLLHTLSTCSD